MNSENVPVGPVMTVMLSYIPDQATSYDRQTVTSPSDSVLYLIGI